MKVSRSQLVGSANLAVLAGMFASLILLVTGCETPEQTAMLGGLLGANAAVANSAQQAAVYAAGAGTANNIAQMQNQQQVAEAGRTQININNSSAGGGSQTKNVIDEKMDDGSTYTGTLVLCSDNKWRPHGNGTYNYTDGNRYSGGWSVGKRQGQGTFTSSKGRTIEGSWENDNLNGEVTVRFEDGTKYEGGCKDGKFHGAGKRTLPDGGYMEGQWRNGEATSFKGNFTSKSSGAKYDGEWNQEDHKGRGCIQWKDGSEYKGQWKVIEGKDDPPDGEGTMTWPDGRKYTGDFRDGQMHGFGKMTYADGRTEEGVWRDDKLVRTQAQTPAQAPVTAPSAPSSTKTGSVSVKADDDTFEVSVDGKFVGNTPARLKLSEGTHVVEVKKAGFKDYRKEFTVSDGAELNLRAVMEKE